MGKKSSSDLVKADMPTPLLDFAVSIRDPVHGDIDLTADEVAVIDTPEMQRLRGIKQLGTAYLVYPGCMHTRFDHSLGTVAAAQRIIDCLRRKKVRIQPQDARLIRLAALVHDVTHIPFGHTFEDERKVFPRHDSGERLRHFLGNGQLGKALARLGVQDDLIELLSRPDDWRGQIVSGTLDADFLDYLRRDSYFSGLSQRYDDRVYTYFCVEDDQLAVDLTKNGLERHDARSEIVHLFRVRYFLTERVYFHHTKVTAGAMVSKALELATDQGVSEIDLYTLSDEGLFRFLQSMGDRAITQLVQGVKTRSLLKRAYLISYDSISPHEQARLIGTYHEDASARRSLEQAIAEEVGISATEVIVYAPAKTALKEAAILARLPGGARKLNDEARPYLDLEALSQQYARLWKFWVFAPRDSVEKVAAAAERLLGLPNELKVDP